MQTRAPIVAGQFYPADRAGCLKEIEQCLAEKSLPEALPERIVAGIVPHAGWVFSGALAAMIFSAVKQRHDTVDTFVLFGAAHGYFGTAAAVYDRGRWATPLGQIQIDEQMAAAVLETGTAVSGLSAHNTEHSIEVQVPFIQHLFADAQILPIITPPVPKSAPLGRAVGQIIAESEKRVICIGSTDLTHYGPRYGFTPVGTGTDALKWASEINDRQFIDLALELKADQILLNAAENGNACGPGAVAATVAVAKKLGKERGILLSQTNSHEIMMEKMATSSTDSVGYAAILF